jgi:catechol 2,3-dioxygenase-like lactoylglutathione lyase family enzyme
VGRLTDLSRLVNRIDHLTINCSDLERSRYFYETLTGLRVRARSSAPRQRMTAFGVEEGRWEGYVLRDSSGWDPVELHLIQWIDPKPVGSPYNDFFHLGFYRTNMTTPSVDDTYAAALGIGASPLAPPSPVDIGSTPQIVSRLLLVPDPDGACVEFSGLEHAGGPRETPRMVHVNANVSDFGRAHRFFTEVFGTDVWMRLRSPPQDSAAFGQPGVTCQWDGALERHLGDHRFFVDLLEFTVPRSTDPPYREANHLGIARLAWEVDDIAEAYALLQAIADTPHGPRLSGPPQLVDYGPEVGIRSVLCFRDADGVAYQFVQKPESYFETT